MERIGRILVPTDFSQHSRKALDYALFLARRFAAEVEVLHAFEPPSLLGPETLVREGDGTMLLSEFLERQAEDALETLVAEVKRETGVVVRKRLARAAPAAAVIQAARDGRHDLIVMGTHGRTGLSHLLAGSVAERVVRLAPCPVLTTRVDDAAELRPTANAPIVPLIGAPAGG